MSPSCYFWFRVIVALFLGAIVPAATGVAADAGAKSALDLTDAEREWLRQHPVVKVGADPNWPPITFFDKDGRHQGVDADLLALMGQRLGVKFEVVYTSTWAEAEAMGKAGKLDVLTSMAYTPERAQSFSFTEPYFAAVVAVIMRQDAPFYTGLRNLRGRIVAMPADYFTTTKLKQDYPEVRLRETRNAIEAMHAVSMGEADATVENLVIASRILQSEGLTNLKIVGITEFGSDLRLATRKDDKVLLGIMEKALASISEEERLRLTEKWVPVDLASAINWGVVRKFALWVFGTAAAVVLVVLIKNRRLSAELKARRIAEAGLRAAHAEKDHLMAMLAHDLNNPLQTMSLVCEGLEKMHPGEDVDIVRQMLGRMSRLVKNVLNVNALESGRVQLRLQRLDLSKSVEEVIAAFRPKAQSKQISLSFKANNGDIMADADALLQVTDNLIGNAIKFTPSGGQVEVTVEKAAEGVELVVSDTGPGIPDSDKPKLFGKFARLSAQPTGGESSHGLGLAIVKELVGAMGAVIRVEDRSGGGAVFRLLFPKTA